ncbi:MAG: thioredoxin family protein [Leptospiraceae bacterium]|nr:thioredoxin family protein [Leptospiraceae bacterium]
MEKIILTLFFLISQTISAESIEFSKESFAKAKSEGKTIVLDVYAWWCPVCNIQKSRLDSILNEEKMFKDFVYYKINNSDSLSKQELDVTSRGTLIIYKGQTEVNRLVLEADKEKILQFLKKGL